jgi:predicted Zn finger-like uncharacterized protein
MFKVVPDQLRISDGWVRCGQCAVVFEAPEHLQPDPAMPAPPVAAPFDAVAEPDPVPVHAPEPVFEPGAGPVGVDLLLAATEPDLVIDPGRDDAAPSLARLDDPLDFRLDEPTHASVSEFLTEPSRVMPLEPDPSDAPVPQPLSFVRQAPRDAPWQRTGMVALCALLVLLLGLQWVRHERDRIAAFAPRTHGWLQALCVPLRCTVAPLRQIESIVVDGSSFRKIRDDVYQLDITIKNAAPVPLAMPSVELALTDTQDQPVLRRVLSPTDLGAAPVLPAGAEWSGAIPVGVTDSAIALRVAGYRVVAFYP